MILRLIRGLITEGQLDALRASLEEHVLRPRDPRGPLRLFLGTSPLDGALDTVILVFWREAQDVADADARGVSPLQVSRRLGLVVEPRHFEVDQTIVRPSEGSPVALRIATGRFSKPGADIEMQELLRQRSPSIGEEMCEAYVGRRIEGRAIDVTFVSAWARRPADRRLEEPFWPDIALRYDEFSVEVYDAVPLAG